MADPLQALYELDLIDSAGQRIGTDAPAAGDQHAVSLAFLAEFWEGQDITPAAIAAHHGPGQPSWLERVQAYVDGFDAVDLSDAELRRCTQGSDLLFHLAVVFREAKMLADKANETPEEADYNSVEATAKAARVGLWAGSFVNPEEWRHAH